MRQLWLVTAVPTGASGCTRARQRRIVARYGAATPQIDGARAQALIRLGMAA
jgi:hypothetical protein